MDGLSVVVFGGGTGIICAAPSHANAPKKNHVVVGARHAGERVHEDDHVLAELDHVVRTGYAKYDFQGVFQKLFAFCTTDLSAVYFDIRKDALYCDAPDSPRRRACRTVLDILFHRLTTWLAPVLVFTMEEVWLERFPGEESSVHLVDMPETPKAWLDEALAAKWDALRDARRVVTGALEVQRTAKVIGSSRPFSSTGS